MLLVDPGAITLPSQTLGMDTPNSTMHLRSGYVAHTVSLLVMQVDGSLILPPAEEERVRRRGCSDLVAPEVLPNVNAIDSAASPSSLDNVASPAEGAAPQQATADGSPQPPPTSIHAHVTEDSLPDSPPREELQSALDNPQLPPTVVPANDPPALVANDPLAPVVNDPPAPAANDPLAPVINDLPAPVVNDPPAPVADHSPALVGDDSPASADNNETPIVVSNETLTLVASDDLPFPVANKNSPTQVANNNPPTPVANDPGNPAGSPRLGIFTLNELPTFMTPDTLKYWETIPGGGRWVAMVQSYLKFEQMPVGKNVCHLYQLYNAVLTFIQCPAHLPTESRPAEVSIWIRTWRYNDNHIPSVTNVEAFHQNWVHWWVACQPPWRQNQEWPLPKERVEDVSWGKLAARGKNGLFLVIMTTAWWATALRSDDQRHLFEAAVDDIHWVIEQQLQLPPIPQCAGC